MGGFPKTASCPRPGRSTPTPPVQLLDAARSPIRPPPPSPSTKPPQELGKARREQSPGFVSQRQGDQRPTWRGFGNPAILGYRAGRGLSAEPRRGAWPGAGAGGRRGTPRRALQGAARSARPGSVRPPARTRSLARLGSVRRGSARCAARCALSPGICRDPSSGREAAGGEARGRGEGARARLRVSARVSPGWCARQAPGPGTETQGSRLPRPLFPVTLGGSGTGAGSFLRGPTVCV